MSIKFRSVRILFLVFFAFTILFNCGGGKQVKEETAFGDVEKMYGEGSKEVIAEGLAELRKAGAPEAYDRAEQDALKKAIEVALGTIIDARTLGSISGQILDEKIYSKRAGYIRSYKVISRRVEDDVAYVKVRAVVGLQKLKDDVMALDILQHRMNLPKTLILIDENNLGSKSDASYNVLVKKFSEKRFTIISPDEISDDYKNKINSLYSSMDKDENQFITLAAKIGMDANADIVIVGKAKAVSGGQINVQGYSGNLKSYQADSSFKVVNVGDGRILAISSKHGAASHIVDQTGGINALTKAAESAADELIDQILKAWEDVLNNGNLLTLYVKGLSITDELTFNKSLKNTFREVKEVYAKQKKGDKSVFTVRYLGTARDFATALVTKENFDFKVNVESYDFGSLVINASKK